MKTRFVKFLDDKGVLEQYLEYLGYDYEHFTNITTLSELFEAFPEEKGQANEWVLRAFNSLDSRIEESQSFWFHIHEDWCSLINTTLPCT